MGNAVVVTRENWTCPRFFILLQVVKLCENWKPAAKPTRNACLSPRLPIKKQPERPNTSLLLIRARFYDPELGEFVSRDPLGFVDGMSLYRAYFVPGGVDPTGACEIQCTIGEAKNHRAVGVEFQNTVVGGPPNTGDWADNNIAVLELSQKILNAANIVNAAAQKDYLGLVNEAIDVLALPSAKSAREGLQKIWKNRIGANVSSVNIWIRVEAGCCKDAYWLWCSNYFEKSVDWINTGIIVSVNSRNDLPIKKLVNKAIKATPQAFRDFSCENQGM